MRAGHRAAESVSLSAWFSLEAPNRVECCEFLLALDCRELDGVVAYSYPGWLSSIPHPSGLAGVGADHESCQARTLGDPIYTVKHF